MIKCVLEKEREGEEDDEKVEDRRIMILLMCDQKETKKERSRVPKDSPVTDTAESSRS